MMKYRLFLLLLLFPLLSRSQQQGDITLNWQDDVKTAVGDVSFTLPQFQPDYMYFDPSSKTLYFLKRFPATGPVNENSLRITDIVYESIDAGKLGDLAAATMPSSPSPKLHSVKARDIYYAQVAFSPIIKEGNGYKRIKSFHYSYAYGANVAARSPNDVPGITNSVLASGNWYRFYVEKSGVYKISRSFLQGLGMDVHTDPRKIKIYGNGGRMLPMLNSTPYPMDLAENAIEFIGEDDGSFDSGDYILFYAEGVDNWNEESGTNNNLYADRSYYYVTSGGDDGKRINAMPQPTAAPVQTTTTFDDYLYHEEDLVNVGKVGREWFGEQFNVENEQEFDFNVPDIDASAAVKIEVVAAASAVNPTTMDVKANASQVGTLTFSAPPDLAAAVATKFNGSFTPAGGTITIKLTYNNNGIPTANAWLDYIRLWAKRKLKGNGKQFRFQYDDAANDTGVLEYQFTNASGISEVWDITDIYNAAKAVNDGGQGQFAFKAQMGEERNYIAVSPSDYYSPLKEAHTRVANQNLKGTIFKNAQGQFQDIDYIIITPEFLKQQAQEVADIHRQKEGMNVKVVGLDEIYQEFSSGKQDIGAIRNFVKYVYYNASTEAKRIKYLNLFGDASFDFKDRIPNNTNIVPILHAYFPPTTSSATNFSVSNTFVTDDFFGVMDPDEGTFSSTLDSSEGLDIAVGRMLVSSTKQAEDMVNKVVEYETAESYGRWRNDYIVITDDLDGNSSTHFVENMENLYDEMVQNIPFVNVRKIYTDSYVQEVSAGGDRYPEAKEQLFRAINYGALVVNYLGHGGEDGMASERIYDNTDAQSLTNQFKYPLFITATCELTKFDNPYRPTTGEYTYWNPKGGAIAMITTTRAILIGSAVNFITNITSKLYAYSLPEYPTMAEALRLAKAQGSGLRPVSFIGDPALMLAVPKPKVVLTELNGVPLAQSADVLQALSHVTLSGEVHDESDNLISNYNGEVAVTVFDKEIARQTLDNDHINENGQPIIYDFNTLGETIFRGNATATNGKFSFDFVVPKDIKIPVAEGRISLYAKRNGVLQDETGYDTTVKIGGINTNAEEDHTPPTVKLYMNDESFVNGGITNASPFLLAYLQDEHGLNTASGIGHDMIAILDGDETHPYLLNDYYEANADDYTHGSLRFPFTDLEKGLHTLTFKAWDVYNNLVTAEIQFVVAGQDGITLEKVLNYPNPFVNYTEFWFTHNRPYEPLDVRIQIFTVSGKVVKTINQTVTTDGFLCRDIKWDGRDDFGDRLGKGVYIYKLSVHSSVTNKTAEKYEKLVLL